MRPETASKETCREISILGVTAKTRHSWLFTHSVGEDGKKHPVCELVETASLGNPGCEGSYFPAWSLDEILSEFGYGKVAKLYAYQSGGTTLYKCCLQYGQKKTIHAVETCFAEAAALCLLDWKRKFKS